MEERQPRKLAVILHADVVGSTALVQKNESLAHARIQDAFRRFSITIDAYNGVTHELRGDALVAEFARASDAVAAGLAFQIENTESNLRIEDDLRPRLRVGISLGEVVIADNTVTGAGVVLAQRIEQLAEPGGVCISGAIHEAVPKYLPFDYSELGKRGLKGFEDPVQVYRASVKAGKQVPPRPEPRVSEETQSHNSKRARAAASIALLVLVAVGLAWWQPWAPGEEPASIERMAFSLPDKPSIAVIPFTNMSGDAEQEYFADGMTEDLITDLSKIPGLFVIARNSAFTYKGKSVKVGQVAEELGVRYVLEGSVRRSGEQVRINAQLIDAISGGHVWAERYDIAFFNVFTVQDEVTREIVSALAINLPTDAQANRENFETTDPLAYDAFLRGWVHYRGRTPGDFRQAITHFEKSIELDPGYGRAYAALAAVYWTVVDRDRSSGSTVWSRALGMDTDESRHREQLNLEMALKNPTPLAYQVAAGRFSRQGQHKEAIEQAGRAIALDPGDPVAHEAMAIARIYAGRPAEGERYIRRAMRLDPLFSQKYLYWLGLAQVGLERFEDAASSLSRAAAGNPDDDSSLIVLAAVYGHLGRLEEARSAVRKANELRETMQKRVSGPGLRAGMDMLLAGPYTLKDIDLWPFQDPNDRDRLRAGLRLAGVPETGASAQHSPLDVAGATTVDAGAAKKLFDRGVLFVDVRGEDSWKNGRIPRAVHLPLDDGFNESNLSAITQTDREVVMYCMGPRCLLSSRACAQAVSWGFQKVYYFRDGYPGWKAAGYPFEVQDP